MRISVINIEWNSWNGFLLDVLHFELKTKEGSFFCINVDSSFCYVDLFFFNIKLWQRVESKN